MAALLSACAVLPDADDGDDPASDAPAARTARAGFARPFKNAPTYAAALTRWQGADDVNDWIGARFQYDMARALLLSETQRLRNARLAIVAPAAFFDAPNGVCVDLSRFAVETLRALDPTLLPAYLMIEFDPLTIQGQTLRRHWVASFQRGGQHYVFADSKRPGHIAGPYANLQDYIDDYARYRGRRIVSFKTLESYERKLRTLSVRQDRVDGP